jgi:hypothetical protein
MAGSHGISKIIFRYMATISEVVTNSNEAVSGWEKISADTATETVAHGIIFIIFFFSFDLQDRCSSLNF